MWLGSTIKEILKNLSESPVTSAYPFAEAVLPENFRGIPILLIDKCTGCSLCAKDCPSDAIKMIPDERTKRKQAPRFDYWKCIRCAQCYYSCRYGALFISDAFELATCCKETATSEYLHVPEPLIPEPTPLKRKKTDT